MTQPPPDDAATVPPEAIVVASEPAAAAPLARPRGQKDPAEPAILYVASLGTPKSASTAVERLEALARILGPRRGPSAGAEASSATTAAAGRQSDWKAFPWGKLTARETEMARAWCSRHMHPATARMTLVALRGVLKMAFKTGHMNADRYQRAIMFSPIRGESLPKGRAMSDAEIAQLWKYIDTLPGAVAELTRALFAIALGGGLRREELQKLRVGDLSRGGEKLRVKGKGRREGIQQLPEWAANAVARWVVERAKMQLRTDALFIPVTADGRVLDQPLSVLGIWRLVTKTTKAAGIEAVSVHDLRRTFCTKMLAVQRLPIVQKLMRHKNPSTTLRYDRSEQSEADEAVKGALDGWAPTKKS